MKLVQVKAIECLQLKVTEKVQGYFQKLLVTCNATIKGYLCHNLTVITIFSLSSVCQIAFVTTSCSHFLLRFWAGSRVGLILK